MDGAHWASVTGEQRINEPLSVIDVYFSLRAACEAERCAAVVVRTMGGGWWWARAARLARIHFRGLPLPPPRPRSGGARGSFAPGHGPRAGASPPPVSELDRADAWLLRKAHETGWQAGARVGRLQTDGGRDGQAVRAREWERGWGFCWRLGPDSGGRRLPCTRREALAAERSVSAEEKGLWVGRGSGVQWGSERPGGLGRASG